MSENERLRQALRNILNSGVTDIDSRIDYIEVQVDRDDWIEAGQTLYKEPDTCVWRHNDYGYHTGCPQDVWLSSELLHIIGCYIEDGLNAIVYCPGCGRKIEVTK